VDLGAGFGAAFGFGAGAGSGVGVDVDTVVGVTSCARAKDGRKSPKASPDAAASADAPMANVRATRDKLLLLPCKKDPKRCTDCRS
jgi:hypothetical protein